MFAQFSFFFEIIVSNAFEFFFFLYQHVSRENWCHGIFLLSNGQFHIGQHYGENNVNKKTKKLVHENIL